MTAKRADLKDLPDWPAVLSREQAAAYVNLSPAAFDEAVTRGTYPPGRAFKRRIQWARKALDESIDRHFGTAPSSAAADPWGAAVRRGNLKIAVR